MSKIITFGDYEVTIKHNNITGGITMVSNEPRDILFVIMVFLQCLLQMVSAAMKAQGNRVTVPGEDGKKNA